MLHAPLARSVLIGLVFLCLMACGQASQPTPAVGHAPDVPSPHPAANSAQQQQADSVAAEFPSASEHAQAELSYRVIDAPNGTFGYDILSDGRLFIHQTNIPGQPGNEGCRTKEQAEKLAILIVGKMKKGEMPPTVTTEELKGLNIQ